MKRIIRSIILAVIIFVSLLLLSGCDEPEPSVPEETPAPTQTVAPEPTPTPEPTPAGEFVTAVRFIVASDVHIADNDSAQEEARLAKLFKVGYEYSAAQEDHTTLDGVFFAGDCSNNGSTGSIEKFFGIIEENARPETTVRAVPGNHEYYRTNGMESDWLGISGYDSMDTNVKLGDFHVILLSPRNKGNGYTDSQKKWLGEQIELSLGDDPTKARPVFVIQHHAPTNTAYGTENWGSSDLTPVLNKYTQIVDFGGHSHFPINDPRSIWQGNFTVLNTGGLSYYEMGIAGVKNDGVFPYGTYGDYTEKHTMRDEAEFYIVEAATDGRMRVKAYDLFSDSVVVCYELGPFDSTGNFEYTPEKMLANAGTPSFPDDTEAECILLDNTEVEYSFTQAVCSDKIQHYRCELYLNGELVKTEYRLSGSWYTPAPQTLTFGFYDLVPSTDYTACIIAVSSFSKESEPYTVDFTTADEGSGVQQKGEKIFALAFDENGGIYDAVSGTELETVGTPEVGYNERLGAPELYMNGSSCCIYDSYKDHYGEILRSVTFEFYGRPDEFVPDGGRYSDVLSNQQNGGCGIELTKDGYAQFYIMVNGKYHYPQAKIKAGEYVHIAGTYDGRVIKLFINGELKDSVAVYGKMTLPATSQYLVIGGDSGPDNSLESLMKGVIVSANIYSYAMSETEIAENYASYNTGGGDEKPICPMPDIFSKFPDPFEWLNKYLTGLY